MPKKSKWTRIIVALVCSETGATNYHTMVNKANTPKLQVMKYCSKLRKRTLHVAKEKLK